MLYICFKETKRPFLFLVPLPSLNSLLFCWLSHSFCLSRSLYSFFTLFRSFNPSLSHLTFCLSDELLPFVSLALCLSGMLREQMEKLNLKDSLTQLSSHTNTKLAAQADTVLAVLAETS